MELLDRYLQAVKKHLPWQRQDDIIAELRANLEAQLEDKEAPLGRPLTKEEAEEWLKQMGSPIQVAARYQRQQYLIGPAIFPTYSYILRLVLTWVTVIYVIANAVAIAVSNQGGEGVLRAALRLPEIWLINAGVVTLIFAVIELTGARFPGKFHAFGPMAGADDCVVDAAGFAAGQRERRRMGKAAELHAGLARSVFRLPVSGLRFARSPLSVPVRSGPERGISAPCRTSWRRCGGRSTGAWYA